METQEFHLGLSSFVVVYFDIITYMSQSQEQKIWNKHVKKDDSSQAADEAIKALFELNPSHPNSLESRKKHAEYSRLALVLSKSAALKSESEVAFKHFKNAIQVLLDHYPVSARQKEAKERNEYWDGALVENQSAQLICLRDMLSLLEFVSKVAPSDEINNLSSQILVLLLDLSEQKSTDVFALISLIEKAKFERAAEAFKLYCEKYCFPDTPFGLDQIITVSTRFLERAIKENSPKNAILALENVFRIFLKDASYSKRIALDMVKAIFPSLRDNILDDAAEKIREESTGKIELKELVNKLLEMSYVGIGDGKVKEIKKLNMP